MLTSKQTQKSIANHESVTFTIKKKKPKLYLKHLLTSRKIIETSLFSFLYTFSILENTHIKLYRVLPSR